MTHYGDAIRKLEVDYLVIGAGATGMGFTDTLVAAADADVLLVDRRHRPGGHWLDAYSFARLHQPSAMYGVASRRLGDDRIDESGPNAGFYERATAASICDYFGRVLDERMTPSGKVRFLGLHEYVGEDGDGHHLRSLATGHEVIATARRRVVDATYIESEIPSRHRPRYSIEPGVRAIPPNDLVDLNKAPSGFTVIGSGKTAMDTCCWLLEVGVDPDRIRWIRPRDPWVFDRATIQPLDLVAAYRWMEAHWVEAAAQAQDGRDFARRLEASGVFMRIDPDVEPPAWRGAILSKLELAALRTIARVEHARVVGIRTHGIDLDVGEVPAAAGEVFVDCTAAGVQFKPARPIFEPGRITLQHVCVGMAALGAATLGLVESLPIDDVERNRLCPPLEYTGNTSDLLTLVYRGMRGALARAAVPDLRDWDRGCRLNPVSAARSHRDDPGFAEAQRVVAANMGPALQNLAGHVH